LLVQKFFRSLVSRQNIQSVLTLAFLLLFVVSISSVELGFNCSSISGHWFILSESECWSSSSLFWLLNSIYGPYSKLPDIQIQWDYISSVQPIHINGWLIVAFVEDLQIHIFLTNISSSWCHLPNWQDKPEVFHKELTSFYTRFSLLDFTCNINMASLVYRFVVFRSTFAFVVASSMVSLHEQIYPLSAWVAWLFVWHRSCYQSIL